MPSRTSFRAANRLQNWCGFRKIFPSSRVEICLFASPLWINNFFLSVNADPADKKPKIAIIASAAVKNTYFGEGSVCRDWLERKFSDFADLRLFSIVNEWWKISDTNLGTKKFMSEIDHIILYLDGSEIYDYDKITYAKFMEVFNQKPAYIKEKGNIDENGPHSLAWHEAQACAGKVFRDFLAEIKKLAKNTKTRRIIVTKEQPLFAVGVNNDQFTVWVLEKSTRNNFAFFRLWHRLVSRNFTSFLCHPADGSQPTSPKKSSSQNTR